MDRTIDIEERNEFIRRASAEAAEAVLRRNWPEKSMHFGDLPPEILTDARIAARANAEIAVRATLDALATQSPSNLWTTIAREAYRRSVRGVVGDSTDAAIESIADHLREHVESLTKARDFENARLREELRIASIRAARDARTTTVNGETVVHEAEVVRMPRPELQRILDDNARLYRQISEVQRANDALIEERRATKATDRARMVREFVERVTPWQECRRAPGLPSASTVRFRVRLVLDEIVELLSEIYDDDSAIADLRETFDRFLNASNFRRDLYPNSERFARVVHEAADVAYTIEGMLATFGVDGTRVFRRIHEANMAKAGAGRDASGKLGKPEGWTPADIAAELREQREGRSS